MGLAIGGRLCLSIADKLSYFISVIAEGKQIFVADYPVTIKLDEALVK